MRWLMVLLLVAVAGMVACGEPSKPDSSGLVRPLAEQLAPRVADAESVPTVAPAAPLPTPRPSSRDSILVPSPRGQAPQALTGVLPPEVSAGAMLVMDDASGAVLLERNADTPLAPASLTKIATAVVTLQEAGDLDRRVRVDVDSMQMPGSTVMGLLPGDEFTVRDLLYGLMLPSGNDAALALARIVSGSDSAFVGRMNDLLARLGLVESHFENPHGLGARNHLTSAYDLAVLTRYAMTVPGFTELASAKYWLASGLRTIPLYNLNTFLTAYPGADGVKVGFTERAGHTLVASATRWGHRVYVVLLNDAQSQTDATKLMNWVFANYTWP